MMKLANKQITCVGDIMLETIVRVGGPPRPNWTQIFDSYPEELGGPAFNLCWYLRNLGWSPTLVGAVGKANYDYVQRRFRATGLNASGVLRIPGETDHLVALLTKTSHYSSYFRAILPGRFDKLVFSKCSGATRIILTGSRHPKMRKALVRVVRRNANATIAFNPSYAIFEYAPQELREIMLGASVCLYNQPEAEHAVALLGLKRYNELASYVRGTLIVTRGQHGAELFVNKRRLHISSQVKANVNAIGAGDAFFAGFLHAFFNGASSEEAGPWGAALSARVVETSLVRAHVSLRQLERRIGMNCRPSKVPPASKGSHSKCKPKSR